MVGAMSTLASRARPRSSSRSLALRAPAPELAALLLVAGGLNLWALSRNGLGNEYYAAAVRSMGSSWKAFLLDSYDPSLVMTVGLGFETKMGAALLVVPGSPSRGCG
jgi:hypothetical protein